MFEKNHSFLFLSKSEYILRENKQIFLLPFLFLSKSEYILKNVFNIHKTFYTLLQPMNIF